MMNANAAPNETAVKVKVKKPAKVVIPDGVSSSEKPLREKPSRRMKGPGSKSVRGKGAEVVSTSIRMNLGTSRLLDWELDLLNAYRKEGEPPWSLGEVVELAIQVVYPEWQRLDELSRFGKLPERRGEPSRN